MDDPWRSDVSAIAEAWRLRARRLDELAAELEGSPAMTVHLRAGDATWRGGLAVTCVHDLRAVATTLAAVVGALRAEAVDCRRTAALVGPWS